MTQHSLTRKKYYSPLIGAALAAASLFQFSLPAFAVGTSAGVNLKNTATATYENEQGDDYSAISNEVTITVGKIAGITNVPNGFIDNTSSPTNTSVLPGDSVSFDFLVTNTGNDTTNIFIPDANTVNNNAANVTVNAVEYSTDGGTSFTARPGTGIVPNVAQNTSIIVRVTGTVLTTAQTGSSISVRLGDTGNNTADINSPDFPGTQNQPDAGGASDPQDQDVRTLTADNANTAVDGEPVNGQREASATNVVTVGSNPLALTRIRKTNAGFTNGTDTTTLSDNVITYNLELDVLNQKPVSYNNFLYNPAALEGRNYDAPNTGNFTGISDQTNLVLISDAIPANTTLDKTTVDTNVTAPSGWTRVYTDQALTVAPEKANWNTNANALTGAITRVGWVYDARTTRIAAGTTQTGFSFNVVTSGLNNTATSIYNMAQTFGSTDDGGAGTTGAITFDESGDQNPNNFNDDGTPGPDETVTTGGNFGVADPTAGNIDVNNDNTATNSPGGEVNQILVTPPAVASNLRNGPSGLPDAIGNIFGATPADDNHDFQNLGAPTPLIANQTVDANGNPNTTYDPAVVTFTNTLRNPTTAQVTNVLLRPISPEDLNLGGTAADLRDGTVVTITYNGVSATYTYSSTGTGSFTFDSGTEITIPIINGNASVNYTVAVNLPADTPLSTIGTNGGYAVPVVAYIEKGTNTQPDTTDTYNVTVNQVYAGYLKLDKKVRVLRNNAVVPGMNFNDPNSGKQPAPGDVIEYQITYSNITEPQAPGANSVLLQANDVQITEDGTVGNGGNNWALDNDDPAQDGDSIIDTLHVPSSALASGGTITYFRGNPSTTSTNATDKLVTRYLNRITNVAPGATGTFTFQRKVTDATDIKELTP